VKDLIIKAAEQGLSHTIYLSCAGFGALLIMLYSLWYGPKLGIRRYKAVAEILIGSAVALELMYFLGDIVGYLAGRHFLGMNSAMISLSRVYIFVPILAWFIGKILREEWGKLCNLFSFSQPFIWGTTSIGCLFTGCCRGYPCEWGLYNTRTCENVFPIQMINAVILILITLFLFFKSKKRNYTVDPELYPTMLVLVGATRFITEFFMDNEKIFLGCSGISFQCLLMWIVGASAIAAIRRRNKSDATFTPNS
jgi:hypothetical protein